MSMYNFILVILPYKHFSTGIFMQGEDIFLEWIFLPNQPSKQQQQRKTYVENASEFIF